MTLELLLPRIGTPTKTNILNDPISSIPYISQVPPTSPITDQFNIDTHQNMYVADIDKNDTALSKTSAQILRDKKNL